MRLTLALVLTLGALALLVSLACRRDTSDQEYAAAMAREHATDSPTPSEAARQAPAAPVTGKRVSYATVDGETVDGYLATPEGAAAGIPGVIVIHEWWGLNDNIEAMARRLAGEGYAALAVDLYGGRTADTPDGARELMQRAMEHPAAAEENLRQAYRYLTDQVGAPRVGVIGWCFGGGWSLQTALLLPRDIQATVIYYGRLVTDRQKLDTLQMPILGFFGAEDRGIPAESARQFEATLRELGKDVEVHIYDGAGHAFANPSGKGYRPEAARDAWQRTVAFFAAHLKGGTVPAAPSTPPST